MAESKRGGRKRVGSKLVEGIGWVKKKVTEDRKYDAFTDEEAETWALFIAMCRWYPDFLLNIFRSVSADYSREELIQKVMIRAFARNTNVTITGSRSLTKTNSKFKQKFVHNIVWPDVKSAYYGPSYTQMAEIGGATFEQIRRDYPALAKHYEVLTMSKDSFGLATKHGSTFTITAIRGANLHDVTAEEYAQEEQPIFDQTEYRRVVLPAVRLEYRMYGEPDRTYPSFQKHAITSASRKQNHAFASREANLKAMVNGKSAFVADIPYQVILLSQMRPWEWASGLRTELTPEEWQREMEARYTGSDSNPVIRDSILAESQKIMVMEERHCCKFSNNKLRPEQVIYIVSLDVANEEGTKNANAGISVIKLTEQKENWFQRDKYKKHQVYVENFPHITAAMQAKRVKELWARFSFDGSQSYIVVDSRSYGKAVIEELMKDMNDGLPPLCIRNHEGRLELELEGALPVIYETKASGQGENSNPEMMRYAEMEFENSNVNLLTNNLHDGIDAYKKYHNIKDDHADVEIAKPYEATKEQIVEILNLKKVFSGTNMVEKRISNGIQRDKWSALKYGLWFAHLLERENLVKNKLPKNEWADEFEKIPMITSAPKGRTITERRRKKYV